MSTPLESWFTSNGGILDSSSIGIATFPNQGKGAVALKDIPSDHTLFTIPRNMILSTRNSMLPKIFGIDEWKSCGLDKGWTGLMLCLMWEGTQGAESPWAGYLQSLPTVFDTPIFWPPEDLAYLKGTAILEKIGKEEAERNYASILLPALHSRPDLFVSLEQNYSMHKYHIAGSQILSRSFTVNTWGEGFPSSDGDSDEDNTDAEDDDGDDGDENVAMVPMADMLNARYGCNNAKLYYEENVLRMVTTKPICAGEQIWNTYGDPPNSDLLRRYGYVDLVENPRAAYTFGSPKDIIEIRADLAVASIQSHHNVDIVSMKERVEWWLDQGGDDVFVLEFSKTLHDDDDDVEIPEEMISFVRLLQIDTTSWSKRKMPKAKVDDNVLKVLNDLIQRRRASYDTSITDDEAILRQTDAELGLNKRNAILVRLGEKQVLLAFERTVCRLIQEENAAERDRDGKKLKRKGIPEPEYLSEKRIKR